MSKTATIVTGKQVKELLGKAVGGIYISRYFDVMTDFYSKYRITDGGLEISVDKMLTAMIPIQEDVNYINYAIEGEDTISDDPYEEWEDSTYFGYKFEIENYMICFNTEIPDDRSDNTLTWEQFKELVANEKYVMYSVQNIDGGSLFVDMNQCYISFTDADDTYFEVYSSNASVEIDKSIVDAFFNDSTEAGKVCYRIEFSNGMSDMTIEPEIASKVF